MPAPLIWLGAAALGAYAGNKLNTHSLKQNKVVASMPGESLFETPALNGAVITCGVYGALDHTGIWVNGNIYELSGEGLVRCVSPSRFLDKRSGERMYIACRANGTAIGNTPAGNRCTQALYHLHDYHVIRNNCHKWVATMLSGQSEKLVSFSDLNEFLAHFYRQTIHWHALDHKNA